MNKILKLLFYTVIISVAISSCNNYDDEINSLNSKYEDLENRLQAIEALTNTMNSNITSLQSLVTTVQNRDYITGVTSMANGYVISFSKNSPITIMNGKDGASPQISVKDSTDGKYYWVLNGELIKGTDNKPISASAVNGTNAIAPKVRINATTNEWEISTDGGTIWTSTGVKATGSSLFTSVDTSDPTKVIFTLADGTKFEIYRKNSTLSERSILFYIGGDNNLLSETKEKINQIRAGWQPGHGELIIYVDQQGLGASLLRVNENKGSDGLYGLDTIQKIGTENSASGYALNRVINKVVTDYPADSYGMIFFSHASGWLPERTLANPRSLVLDQGEGTTQEMKYTEFASAIPDKQFDFIIFEACLMSDVMSMYEFRNKADYILASSAEIVSPCFTLIYKNDIMKLFDTQSSVPLVITSFAQSYYNYLMINFPDEANVYHSTTLSMIKMDEMENLASVTKTALNGAMFNEDELSINDIQHFDRPGRYGGTSSSFVQPRYFDFEQAVDSLAPAQSSVVKAQIEKTVVWKVSTPRFLLENYSTGIPNYSGYNGFFINHHCGLTTYIKQSIFPETNSAFENSSWYKAIY